MDWIIRHTEVQYQAGIRPCGCSSCLMYLSPREQTAGVTPSSGNISSAKASWDSSTRFMRDTLSRRRLQPPAAGALPKESPKLGGCVFFTSQSDSSRRCLSSLENAKKTRRKSPINSCFFRSECSQVMTGAGFASDRVYLSDGYPQATAGLSAATRPRLVYLSDGYPQATAFSCVTARAA